MAKLCEALFLPKGVTAVVGGGGKTALINRLALELGENARVLKLTTTRIWIPAHERVLYNPTPAHLIEAYRNTNVVTVGRMLAEGKLGAPDGELTGLFALADYVLIEADGSRGLPVKAPATHEPVFTGQEKLVLAVAGISAVGEPIEKVAHRPELYAALLIKQMSDAISCEDISKVLISPQGQRKNVVSRFAVVLNQCDDDAHEQLAERCALMTASNGVTAVCTSLQARPDFTRLIKAL